MAEELARPSVTVRQVLQTETRTPTAPLLRSVVVGPCNQVVETQLQSTTGAPVLNSQAQVALPASLQAQNASGDPPVYALSARSPLCFSVNNKQKIVVPFPTSGNYTPSTVARLIREAMAAAGETDAVAEVVGTTPISGTAFRLRTVARDEFQQIEVDPDGPAAAAKITGTVDLTTLTYPGDVSGLTLIVSVDEGDQQTITLGSPANAAALVTAIAALTGAGAALSAGNELEITTDSANALSSIEIIGGTLLSVVGLTAGDIAVGEGSSSSLLAAFGFSTTDLEFGASKYAQHELVIPPKAFPDPRANLADLVFKTDTIRAFLNSNGATLIEQLRTSAPLRISGAVTAVDDGDGDNRTPFVNSAGQNFLNPTPSSATVTAAGAPNFGLLSNKTLVLSDGRAPRTVTFGTVTTITDVVNAINAVFDTTNGLVAVDSGGSLQLTCTRQREDGGGPCRGEDSFLVIYGGTAFNGALSYLDTGVTPVLKPGRFRGGVSHKAMVGDEVYVDGVLAGIIAKVAPSGVTSRLRLDREVATSFSGMTMYIVAKNLTAGDSSRPQPSLLVEGDGQLILKPGLIRSLTGSISEAVVGTSLIPGRANVFVGYTALRLDVSNRTRGILQLQTLEQVEELLSPIDERNPLGLGVYQALQASPRFQVAALGIDEVSVEEPEGTTEAYARAAAHLEAFEVYAIALLTHSQDAVDIFQTHVVEMSRPDGKAERLVLWCPKEPSEAIDTLVASGSQGNTVGATGDVFDTGIADLPLLLQEQGIDTSAAIPVSAGLYLDVETDGKRYSIIAVSGPVVTVTDAFVPGENDDSYYSSDLLSTPLVNIAFGIRIRGEALELPDGSPDLDAIADTYKTLGQSYNDRRVWVVAPDEVYCTLNGVEARVPGYYACAVIAGMIGHFPVSQSFTNLAMPVLTRVLKSNGRFTERQLSRMAYGGIYVLIQDGANLPVIARQAITSDSTSEEARMDIILKEVDLLAKTLRTAIRSQLGVTNITDNTVDIISAIVDSVRVSFTEREPALLRDLLLLEIGLSPTSNSRIALAIRVFPHYALNGVDITLYI